MRQMLKKIFSIENKGDYKHITIFGVNFKSFSPKERLNFIQIHLETLDNKLSSPKFTYKFYPLEQFFPQNYFSSFCNKDLSEKYIKLTKGLDPYSTEILTKTLYRILQYGNWGQDTFLIDEKEYYELEKLMQICREIIKLSDELYVVNGHVVSGNIFCASALYHKHFIDEVVDKQKILENDIIDAGAYIGDSALVLSPYTKGKIHSFEPEMRNFKKLKKTIDANSLKNVIPVKCGLGSEVCEKDFFVSDFDVTSSYNDDCIWSKEKSDNREHVAITTIDKYVEENNIKIGLIKTDVERFEQELLKGAINTIKRDKPVLMISIYHTYDDFWNIKPLIESWNLGYTFTIRKPASQDICCDLVLNAEVPVENT